MQVFRRYVVFALLASMLTVSFSGCSLITPGWKQMDEQQKKEAVIEKYQATSVYFHKFNHGLLILAKVLMPFDPKIVGIALISIQAVDNMIASLDKAIADYKANILTAEELEQKAKAVNAALAVANDDVGKIQEFAKKAKFEGV